MRPSWLLLGSVGLFMACGGSVFRTGDGSAGGAGLPALGGASGNAGESQIPKGGAVSGGAPNGGAPNGGGSTAGAASGGTSGAGGKGGAAGVPTSCPLTVPKRGDPCMVGTPCSYGDDPRPACRQYFGCPNFTWVANTPLPEACKPIIDCSMTPSGFPVVGKACKTSGEECSFDGGSSGTIYCRCSFCGTDASCPPDHEAWACAGPPLRPCPAQLPNEGQPCDTPVKDCFYGVPCQGVGMSCDGKLWSRVSGGCAN